MKLTKPDKVKTQNKIIKVIDSCETLDHIQVAVKMVNAYIRMFKADTSAMSFMTRLIHQKDHIVAIIQRENEQAQ